MKRLRLVSIIILLVALAGAGYFKFIALREGDKVAPIVNVDASVKEVSIHDDKASLLEGVTATDSKDGDVTDSIVIESISSFIDDNRRIVTYAAFDEDKHVGKATRQIQYTDYTSPEFEIESPLMFPVDSSADFLEGVTATDCIDGDISGDVHFAQGYDVYSYEAGDIEAAIEVTNSVGDTVQLPVMLSFYDTSTYNMSPRISLKKYVVYTNLGKSLKLASYIDDISAGSMDADASDVTINADSVDYNTPGAYFVKYSLENEDGYVGYVYLTVVVRE